MALFPRPPYDYSRVPPCRFPCELSEKCFLQPQALQRVGRRTVRVLSPQSPVLVVLPQGHAGCFWEMFLKSLYPAVFRVFSWPGVWGLFPGRILWPVFDGG